MTIQKTWPRLVIHSYTAVLLGRVRVKSIRGFSWPGENLYMDYPGPCTFPKLSCRVHGFFPQALGLSRICISEYMDFPSVPWMFQKFVCPSTWIFPWSLGFSKNLYVRVHGFFFPTVILYIDLIWDFKPFVFQNVALQKINV